MTGGGWDPGEARPAPRGRALFRAHERRPSRTGVRKLHHPQGVRLDGHLLRGGAATTFRHCTSPPFVRGHRTRRPPYAQDPNVPGCPRPPNAPRAAGRPSPTETQAARSSNPVAPVVAASTWRARSRTGSVPAGVLAGTATGMSGVSPTWWIQTLFGVSHLAIVRRKPPLSSESCWKAWIVPLPYDWLPISRAPARGRSAPATLSLAPAGVPSMRT